MFRQIDACYFLSDNKSTSYLYQNTRIRYFHKINSRYLDLRIVKHFLSDYYNDTHESAKFLDHILILKDIFINRYERSIVSDFVFDESVIAKVAGLDFAFHKFNILSHHSPNMAYLIDFHQTKTIMNTLPIKNICDKNYFYELIRSLFFIRDFQLNITDTSNPIIQDSWSYVFN